MIYMANTIDTSSIDSFAQLLNIWKDFYCAYLLPNAMIIALILIVVIIIVLFFMFMGNLFKLGS